jgi:excisionase family DNA binding protein
MSPAQAAQVAGVSRWTIMRAIKAQELQAMRDNRNHWQIAPDALDRWRVSTVRTPDTAHTLPTYQDSPETLAKLAAETARADAAEADRDAWRKMAEKLADRPQQEGWWPWRRR